MADMTGKDQLFGESLPGTGGDFIDSNDVEGHMSDQDKIDQGGPEGVAGGIRVRTPNVAGDDTEGHRNRTYREAIPTDEGGPEGVKNDRWKGERADGGEDDVEGHNRNRLVREFDGSEPEGYGRSPRPQTLDGADDDVEGHRRGPGGNLPGATEGGPEGIGNDRYKGQRIDGSEDDVEGHRRYGGYQQVDGGPEGIGNDRYKGQRIDGGEDDVEGHIYTGGPSTQGEFTKRGPGENPHGERLR
ncbi:MAG TPA: hypothetical protein VFY23_08810 [Candidatus Limnocylindrales bacterium]|nr:hypothetical protein [Candidatus Limnocylindrales bacterium]